MIGLPHGVSMSDLRVPRRAQPDHGIIAQMTPEISHA